MKEYKIYLVSIYGNVTLVIVLLVIIDSIFKFLAIIKYFYLSVILMLSNETRGSSPSPAPVRLPVIYGVYIAFITIGNVA